MNILVKYLTRLAIGLATYGLSMKFAQLPLHVNYVKRSSFEFLS
jgi:hypothetical protein